MGERNCLKKRPVEPGPSRRPSLFMVIYGPDLWGTPVGACVGIHTGPYTAALTLRLHIKHAVLFFVNTTKEIKVRGLLFGPIVGAVLHRCQLTEIGAI